MIEKSANGNFSENRNNMELASVPDVLQMVWYTGHNTYAYTEKRTAASNAAQQSQFRPHKRLQLLPMSRPPLIYLEIRVVPKDNIALHLIRRLILVPSR